MPMLLWFNIFIDYHGIDQPFLNLIFKAEAEPPDSLRHASRFREVFTSRA
jgi:hypothetical protein